MDEWSVRRKAATYTEDNASTEWEAHTDIHALREIRTHDPGVRASEDSSCLIPRWYRDRQ
jgi:hypothetical protein